MLKKLYFLYAIVGILTFSSCYEDTLVEDTLSPSFSPEKIYLNEIRGLVIDTLGMPISEVEIKVNDKITYTDENGKFVVSDVPIGEQGSYISATHLAYLKGGIRIYGADQLSINTTIVLVPVGITYSFSSSESQEIIDPSGVSLSTVPSNFLRDNIEYDGEVNVNIYWVNHKAPQGIPYGLQVFDAFIDNQTEFDKINSFSTAYISVTDQNGIPLDIKPESPIKVFFPTNDEADNATSADLLSFNENLGLWIKEGQANYTGNGYEAFLNHFSWWSVATTEESTELCIDFNLNMGPANEDNIFIISKSDGSVIHIGGVDYNSDVCLLIPIEQPFIIEVFTSCLVSTYKRGFEGSALEGEQVVVTIESEPMGYVINGNVSDCFENPLSQEVDLYYNTELSQDFYGKVTDDFTITLDPCFESEYFFVSAVDPISGAVANVEVAIVPDILEYSVGLTFCDYSSDIASEFRIGDTYYGEEIIGRQNPQETVIIAEENSATPIILGIDGFDTGTFSARLLDNRGNGCEGTATITTYGEVGELIEGTFIMDESAMCPGYTGSFIAIREK